MSKPLPLIPRLAAMYLPGHLTRQASWVTAPLFLNQGLRLVTNIVLARILAPEIFGVMLLINTLRTGVELLSDIGVGQSVVRSPNGEDRRFLNVAWTLQFLRGGLLFLMALVAAAPVADIYNQPELFWIVIAVSPVFLFTGIQSPALFLIQRRVNLSARAVYDISYTVFHCAFSIVMALLLQSVWALVWALVVSTAFTTLMSYVVGPKIMPKLAWDPEHFREIVTFGKWIFLSTAVYFAASSYDRVYFVAVLPLALAGVYSVARTFADVLGMLARKAGSTVVFPKVAALQDRRGEAADRLRLTRKRVLMLIAVASGLAMAGSDKFMLIAYDERYVAAAFMLPILLVSIWFSVLATFGDSILMGCSRPAPGAIANVIKFVVMLIGLPFAVAHGSLLEGLLVLIGAEAARWAALVPGLQKERFASLGDDLMLTVLMFVVALGTKLVLGSLGIVPTVAEWWSLHGLLHV